VPPENLTGYDRKRRYRHKNIEFWAEGGLVALEEQNTGQFVTLTQDEARAHFAIILEQYRIVYQKSTNDRYLQQVRDLFRALTCNLDAVLQDAKEQGDPTPDAVMGKKAAAEMRSELAAYNTLIAMHGPGGMSLLEPGRDPRTYMIPGGAMGLRHGKGVPMEKKYHG
jgi:hypothetical protein